MWADPSGMSSTLNMTRDVLNAMPSSYAPNTPEAARAAEERIAAVYAAQSAYRAQSAGVASSHPSGSYSTGLNICSSAFYTAVERQVIASSGGMSHWTSSERLSTPFLSKNNSIFAWSLRFHELSRYREYGAWIYRNRHGQYFFRRHYTGTATEVPIGDTRPLSGATTVAWIHTHPHVIYRDDGRAEFFSGGDGNFSSRHNVPGFLVTPSGTVRRIDPSFPLDSHGYFYQGEWHNLKRVEHNFMYNDQPMVTVFIEDIFYRRRF